jgi:hypothetical protein
MAIGFLIIAVGFSQLNKYQKDLALASHGR